MSPFFLLSRAETSPARAVQNGPKSRSFKDNSLPTLNCLTKLS